MKFKLHTPHVLIQEQKGAVDKLVKNIKNNVKYQTLLGVTGSGKTFTVANVIHKLQRPTLIISHNKTLAAQLYQEMRDLFPDNA
ncbi:MAG: DEAD/DEAH box helicase family protein, partial [bacterium]|nr:DEAD/DEAH box helicase family protein [bacterium]